MRYGIVLFLGCCDFLFLCFLFVLMNKDYCIINLVFMKINCFKFCDFCYSK